MLSEFMDFLRKFNVIPSAVAFVIALAIVPVIDAVVSLLMTAIGLIAGAEGSVDEDGNPEPFNFDAWTPADLPLGALITALITFVIIAFAIFVIVKALNKAGAETDLAPTPDQKLLGEIRDLLKQGR